MSRDTGAMAQPTLAEIQAEVERLAAVIDAPPGLLPTFGTSRHGVHAEIEMHGEDSLQMSWVVRERGEERERHTTLDLDELLYWVFRAVTSSMASQWEVAHRVEGQDFRKLMFTKEFELLGTLNPSWAERRRAELGDLVREAGLLDQ